MRVVAEWMVEDVAGWTADYRLVERRTWLWPVRIDGRWHRGDYAEVHVMYAEENPPTGWLTVMRSLDADRLMPGPHGTVTEKLSQRGEETPSPL